MDTLTDSEWLEKAKLQDKSPAPGGDEPLLPLPAPGGDEQPIPLPVKPVGAVSAVGGDDDATWLAKAKSLDADSSFLERAKQLDNDLSPFRTQTVEELAQDHSFKPKDFYLQHEDLLQKPEDRDKLVAVDVARRKNGITPGAVVEGLSNVPAAVGHFFKGAYDVAKSFSIPEISESLAKRVQGGDSVKDALSKEATKKIAEAGAGVESMATGLGGLARTALRSGANQEQNRKIGKILGVPDEAFGPRMQGDFTDPANFFAVEDPHKRFFNDVEVQRQQQKIAQGNGEVSEVFGMDAKNLAKEGIELDPEVIAGFSQVSDPTLWLPMLAGLKAARVAGAGFEIANASGQVIAKAATRNAAEKFIQSAAKLVEKGAGAADAALAKRTATSIATPMAAIEVLSGHVGIPGLAATMGTKLAARGVAKTIGAAAKVAGSEGAIDLAGGAMKGAATGAAFGVPFAAGIDEPADQVTMIGTGATLGALGGAGHVAGAKTFAAVLRARQLADAAFWQAGQLEPVRDFQLKTPGMESLEAEHAKTLELLKQANPNDANILNRLRAGMATERAQPEGANGTPPLPVAPPVEGYLMSPDFAGKLNPELVGKEGAFEVNVPDANGGTKKILAWVLGSEGLQSLTHEPGHFFAKYVATPEERAKILAAIPEDFQKRFNADYLSRPGLTDAQRARIQSDPVKLQDELLAELFSAHLEGKKLDNVPVTLLQQTYGAINRSLERLEMIGPEITSRIGPGISRGLGVKQPLVASDVAGKIVEAWLNDPQVAAALNEIQSPPKIETAKPVEAAPAPVVTSAVTPEHEKILAGLKKAIPGKAHEKLVAIAEKLKRGETLTDTEKNLWSGIDEAASANPTAPAAPTAPPVIEPAKPAAPLDISPEPVKTPVNAPEVAPAVPAGRAATPADIRPAAEAAPASLRTKPTDYSKFVGASRAPAVERLATVRQSVSEDKSLTPEQKAAVDSLLANPRVPHDVVYNAAENVSGTDRANRRVDVEAARGNPELRAVASKLASIPLDARLLKNGEAQIQFWSGDKVLANIEEATRQLKNAGQEFEIPYDHKGGKLTDEGNAALASDLQKYTENQDNGYRGDGQKLTRPEDFKGFIPDENPDYTPQPISAKSAEFINLLMGEDPPETARVNAGTVPIQARAKQLAAANAHTGTVIQPAKNYKAPFADVQITDYNNLRARLTKAGVNLKGLTEAHEWVNAKEIQSAKIRPDIKLNPTSTDVTAAGFLPEKDREKPTNSRGLPLKVERRLRTLHAKLTDSAEALRSLTPKSRLSERDDAVESLGGVFESLGRINLNYDITKFPALDWVRDQLRNLESDLGDLLNGDGPAKAEDAAVVQRVADGIEDLLKPETRTGIQNASDNPSFLPEKTQDETKPRTGLEFKKFFSDVAAGRFGKSDVPFVGLQDLSDVKAVEAERLKHWSNFENHIQRSIPMLHEEKTRLADGVIKTFGKKGARLLDIGSSEGDYGKAISALTDGRVKTVSLDPNPQMAEDFRNISQVKGATQTEDAFGVGFDDNGRWYPPHNPKEPYDIINEAVTFQFIDPNRDAQIAEVKRLLKPDGVFTTIQKFKTADWAANELKKDRDYKAKYFTTTDLKAKEKRVGFQQSKEEEKAVGMVDNMVSDKAYEKVLTSHFKHVVQYWDSGNFKGYAASDNPKVLRELVKNIGDLDSEFATVKTPRNVEGTAFLPSKFWLERNGATKDARGDHAKAAAEELKLKITNDTREKAVQAKMNVGAIRGQIERGTLFLDGNATGFNDLPKSQRNTIEDVAIERGLPVVYNGQFIEDFGAAFLPVTTENERQKFNPEVRKVAKDYMRDAGITLEPHSDNFPVREKLATQIADAYENGLHKPADPRVKRAFDAFAKESADQWNHIVASGVQMERWNGEGQPYKNSAEMQADVRDNKHLWFFPTDAGFGPGHGPSDVETHPRLQPSGVTLDGRELTVSDVFRAVHDYFGHAKEGYEFGPRGEYNAYLAHSRMFSDEARPAMAAETLGQNSWVNFGKHLRDESGHVPTRGEPGYVPLTQRPFAEQKSILLPKELVDAAHDQGAAFLPEKAVEEDPYAKYNVAPRAKKSSPTAWILPDGEDKPLKDAYHENDLAANATDYNERFGTSFSDRPDQAARLDALNAGFVRIRYTPNNGQLAIEANAKFWARRKDDILNHALEHETAVDKLYVNLTDDAGNQVDNVVGNVFTADDKAQAIRDLIDEVKAPSVTASARGPGLIQRARAYPDAPDIRPLSRKDEAFLPARGQADLFGDKVERRETDIRKMTPAQIAKQFPEVVKPEISESGAKKKVPYDFADAPLVKKLKTEDEKVSTYADALATEARKFEDMPEFQSGLRWYSEFVPKLKLWFGKDHQVFAELLAASSPRTNPGVNFGYAVKAFEGWLRGEYDPQIKKFNEGLSKAADGSLKKWYAKNATEGDPKDASDSQMLAAWVDEHDLIPTQWDRVTEFGDPKEVKFGMHGERILRVMARRWTETNEGPKVKQFLANLTGVDHGATIDVWASRSLRRLGYDVGGKRWRLPPEQENAVSDADFAFGQKVFAKAAEKMNLTPDALQGGMWFAEKKYWANRGWQRLDLGDFRTELEDFVTSRKLRAAQTGLFDEMLPLNVVQRRGETSKPVDASEIRPVAKRTRELFDIKPAPVYE